MWVRLRPRASVATRDGYIGSAVVPTQDHARRRRMRTLFRVTWAVTRSVRVADDGRGYRRGQEIDVMAIVLLDPPSSAFPSCEILPNGFRGRCILCHDGRRLCKEQRQKSALSRVGECKAEGQSLCERGHREAQVQSFIEPSHGGPEWDEGTDQGKPMPQVAEVISLGNREAGNTSQR